MTIVYFLHAIYNILSFFCRINNVEFVIDDSPFILRRTTSEEFVIDDSPFILRRTTSEEFVIDDLRRTHKTHRTTNTRFMTFFVDDILLPIQK